MAQLGFPSFHFVGHDRGARVAHQMALDHPECVRTFTCLDVVPSLAAFESMDRSLSFAWFHWHLMRQPAPLPETLINSSAKTYLDFLLELWVATDGAITPEAYTEYLRCFTPDMIRASCLDYRAIELDLVHDQADCERRFTCPMLVLWGATWTSVQDGKQVDALK